MTIVKRFSFFLLPSIFQGAVSVLMLPVTTYILGPEDYGVFAFVLAITGLGTMMANMGAGYLLAAHYPVVNADEKKQMISNLLILGIFILTGFTVLFAGLWPWLVRQWNIFSSIPSEAIILAFIGMFFTFPWLIALDIITLEGKAGIFARALIGQSVFSAAAVTISLYVFKLGLVSLFVAGAVGSTVLFFEAMKTLGKYFQLRISRAWIKKMWRLGPLATAGNIVEQIQTFIERAFLSLQVGFAQLGLYSHSQQYKNLAFMPVKAVILTMWPITLLEARDGKGDFPRTKQAWDVANMGITIIGLLFATFGKEIIALLTHNKFTAAYPLVVFWMVCLLVQNTGKPQTGILYADDRGRFSSGMKIGAAGAGIVAMIVLVPQLGIIGALLGVLVQNIIYRVGIQVYIHQFRQSPFQDWSVLIGSGLILLTLGVSIYYGFSLVGNLILFVGLTAILMIVSRHVIMKVLSRFLYSIGIKSLIIF